jgi:hypothetical protein
MEIQKAYDQPLPVRCNHCNKLLALDAALKHAREVNSDMSARRAVDRVRILMHYPLARHITPWRRWAALPDLDIQVDGSDHEQVQTQMQQLIATRLAENASTGRQPPWPKSPEESTAVRGYTGWLWEKTALDVTDVLLPLND